MRVQDVLLPDDHIFQGNADSDLLEDVFRVCPIHWHMPGVPGAWSTLLAPLPAAADSNMGR